MWHEFTTRLADWSLLDTWIAVTGAFAAMACAVPGTFLVLRRQSLLGDAISHTVLLGVVGAHLLNSALREAGWIASVHGTPHLLMFAGAVLVGILSSVLTEAVQEAGRVESSAALGVVFTTLFALGLLLVRAFADNVHIDPDCVLYGAIETVWSGEPGVPQATVVNAAMLAVNLLLATLFFKQLRITTFDPGLAKTMGVNPRLVNYLLAAVTAATLTAAFESVGSILVIAMLVVPAATASLLTRTLAGMLCGSLILAALGAVLGHAMAITLPAMVFHRLGFAQVSDASTAGMMAFSSGVLFVVALLFAPHQGILSQVFRRWRLALRITGEDVLGLLYRLEERSKTETPCQVSQLRAALTPRSSLLTRAALWNEKRAGHVRADANGLHLTQTGRSAAQNLVRSHRLWESYLAKHWPLKDDHLHEPAERAEHFIDPAIQSQLARELKAPPKDPHGKAIPPNTPNVR